MCLLEGRSSVHSRIRVSRQVRLRTPVFIVGLPGMGFVAVLTTRSLIQQLKAQRFAEVISPHFPDLAVASATGAPRFPTTALYFWQSGVLTRDIVVVDGNTQPLTVFGQYELSGRLVGFAHDQGCSRLICLGGLKRETLTGSPRLYGTCTDYGTLTEVQRHGVAVMEGKIYGMTGVLLGLAAHRSLQGVCVLAETLGTAPDATAAKAVLTFLGAYLGLPVDGSALDAVAHDLEKALEPLGGADPIRREEIFRRF